MTRHYRIVLGLALALVVAGSGRVLLASDGAWGQIQTVSYTKAMDDTCITLGTNGSSLKWSSAAASTPARMAYRAAPSRQSEVVPAGALQPVGQSDYSVAPIAPRVAADVGDFHTLPNEPNSGMTSPPPTDPFAASNGPGALNDNLLQGREYAPPEPLNPDFGADSGVGIDDYRYRSDAQIHGDPEAKPRTQLEEALARRQLEADEDECPLPSDLKPIGAVTVDITASEGEIPRECTLGDDAYLPRTFGRVTYTWKASAFCHKPLYFDNTQLEMYGHSWGPLLQPVVSAGRFWATIPVLPYKMGLKTPNECVYTLGHYRVGSCAPYMIDPLPLSVRAAAFEGAAVVGGIYAIP